MSGNTAPPAGGSKAPAGAAPAAAATQAAEPLPANGVLDEDDEFEEFEAQGQSHRRRRTAPGVCVPQLSC
jgi:hypothetical protein